MLRGRPLLPLLILAPPALLLALLALASARPGSSDDLFVELVHARALLERGSLAHEEGEGAVESFTSPLDLGLKTLSLALWRSDGVAAAWWESTLLYLSAVLALCYSARRLPSGEGGREPPPWVFPLGAAALALSPGLAEGTSYLLETPLVVFLIALFLPLSEGPPSPLRAGVVTLLLALARPELALVGLLWALPQRRTLLGALLALVALESLRLACYGSLLPNSFYAKASDSRWLELRDGLSYLLAFARGEGSPHLAPALAGSGILLAALALPFCARGPGGLSRSLALAGPLYLVAVIVGGGDGYRGARLLAPAVVLILLALTALAAGRGSVWVRRGARALLALVLLSRLLAVLPDSPAKLAAIARGGASQADYAAERRALGRIAALLPPGSTLAARHLQMAEYFEPSLGYLDLTGLCERRVARRPAPGPIRFGRTSIAPALDERVEAIHLYHQLFSERILASRSTAAWLDAPAAERALVGDPLPGGEEARELARRYRTLTLIDGGGRGRHVNLLVRADLAAGLALREGVRVGPPSPGEEPFSENPSENPSGEPADSR